MWYSSQEIRDRDLVREVPPEDLRLVLSRELPTAPGLLPFDGLMDSSVLHSVERWAVTFQLRRNRLKWMYAEFALEKHVLSRKL